MRAVLSLVIVCCLLVAGCIGPVAQDGDGTPTPVGPPETNAPTPTADGPVPTPGDDAPAGATASNTIDYTSLTEPERAAFAAAREDVARFASPSPYLAGEYVHPDALAVFEAHDYVVRNGTYYAVGVSFGSYRAQYGIHVEVGDLGANATARNVSALPSTVRDEVRWAVENGSYTAPLGKWDSLPDAFEDLEYVRVEGETYRLLYAVGDYPVRRLELEPVCDTSA